MYTLMKTRTGPAIAGRPAVAAALAVIAPLFTVAPALAHDLKKDGDPSNDWVEGLRNNNGNACCGDNDCRPAVTGSMTSLPGGSFQIEVEGERFEVPESSIIRDMSPDGRAWVCLDLRPVLGGYAYSVRGIRCLVLPPTT